MTEALKNNVGASQIKSIVNVKKRIGLDGVYYQVIMETNSKRTYKILIYTIPSASYHEIILYEAINTQYNK